MRAVLVPGVLALLPEYAGLQDPVAELRAACLDAVAWAAADGPVTVLASEQGRRVAEALVVEAVPGLQGSRQARPTEGSRQARPAEGSRQARPPGGYVVVGNGSAKRRDTSPGYVDERALGFDADLGRRLRSAELGGIDQDLAAELWADTAAIAGLDGVLPAGCAGTVDYDDDPYGVQYWVVRWDW